MGGFGSGGHNATGAATCESCHVRPWFWRIAGLFRGHRLIEDTWNPEFEACRGVICAAAFTGRLRCGGGESLRRHGHPRCGCDRTTLIRLEACSRSRADASLCALRRPFTP